MCYERLPRKMRKRETTPAETNILQRIEINRNPIKTDAPI